MDSLLTLIVDRVSLSIKAESGGNLVRMDDWPVRAPTAVSLALPAIQNMSNPRRASSDLNREGVRSDGCVLPAVVPETDVSGVTGWERVLLIEAGSWCWNG
jgi:hypothetical protein